MNHRRCYTNVPQEVQNEEVTCQIDRLNYALEAMMKEIEISSVSRNPSRRSAFNGDLYGDITIRSDDEDDEELPTKYSHTIETLLLGLDRQQMQIEDFWSEQKRKVIPNNSNSKFCNHCAKNAENLRSEIWQELSSFRSAQHERDRKKFEENLSVLDEIKLAYNQKKNEVMIASAQLKMKEKLLLEKEKELRDQRLTFDKQKIIWEKENGTSVKPEPIKPNDRSVHQRASSFSYISSPITQTPEKAKKPDNAEGYMEKQQRLQNLQNELKELTKESPNASGDVKIESVKNQIARLRADLAMSESSKTTRLINNVMISMQKEAQRDDKGKKLAIANIFNKFIDEGFLKTLN